MIRFQVRKRSSIPTRRTCDYKWDLFSKDRGSGLLSPVIKELVLFLKDSLSIRIHVSGAGKIRGPNNKRRRWIIGQKEDSRRSAAKIEPTDKNIAFSCNISKCWIIVFKANLRHFFGAYGILICVLSVVASVSPFLDSIWGLIPTIEYSCVSNLFFCLKLNLWCTHPGYIPSV